MRAVLTEAGAQFVTPLSLAALTEDKVYTELFDLTDETEMGHIQLSREADLVVVAPATADLLAKMAQRPRRRPRHHAAARHRQAGAGRAGDERAHVAASGDAAQPRDAEGRRRRMSSAPTRARWRAASIGPGRLAEPPAILAAIERCCSASA